MYNDNIAESLERLSTSYKILAEAFIEQLERSSELTKRLLEENKKLLDIIEGQNITRPKNTVCFNRTCE